MSPAAGGCPAKAAYTDDREPPRQVSLPDAPPGPLGPEHSSGGPLMTDRPTAENLGKKFTAQRTPTRVSHPARPTLDYYDAQAAPDYSDEQAALVEYCRPRSFDPRDSAHIVYVNARQRGATPEQAAALPLVRALLALAYQPCAPDAPLDSLAFSNHVRRTIHLARLATDTYPREPARPLNEVEQRLLRNSPPRHMPIGPERTTNSGTVPTGRAPDPDLWTAATLNVPEILLAATRRLGLPSPSEHDLGLATRLRQLDWTPQQIADLLWWNRRKRGENLKHPGYYTRTVDKAVNTVAQRRGDR